MQRLSSPGLVPSSMEAGGMIHSADLAMTAPGTPPGWDGGQMAYASSTDLPVPGQSGSTIALPTDPVGARPRDEGGRWTTQAPDESPWRPTPTAGTA